MKIAINSDNSNVIVSVKTELSTSTLEGEHLQFQTPNTTSGGPTGNINKRPISLDLKNTSKKQRLVAPSPLIIGSPDTQNIKALTTPDLEKILHLLPTPQPGLPGLVYQTKAAAVTSEQEAFGKGFEEALHILHNSNSNKQSQPGNINNNIEAVTSISSTSAATTTAVGTGMSGGSFTYTNLESFNSVSIKDEPQNPPASPPVSPIDMVTQEKIKLERKRLRNRVAASKCRKRKLERISKLEDKVKILKGENTDLGSIVKNLKEHVAQLKKQVIEHIESGCSIQTMCNGTTFLQNK